MVSTAGGPLRTARLGTSTAPQLHRTRRRRGSCRAPMSALPKSPSGCSARPAPSSGPPARERLPVRIAERTVGGAERTTATVESGDQAALAAVGADGVDEP